LLLVMISLWGLGNAQYAYLQEAVVPTSRNAYSCFNIQDRWGYLGIAGLWETPEQGSPFCIGGQTGTLIIRVDFDNKTLSYPVSIVEGMSSGYFIIPFAFQEEAPPSNVKVSQFFYDEFGVEKPFVPLSPPQNNWALPDTIYYLEGGYTNVPGLRGQIWVKREHGKKAYFLFSLQMPEGVKLTEIKIEDAETKAPIKTKSGFILVINGVYGWAQAETEEVSNVRLVINLERGNSTGYLISQDFKLE